MTNAGASNQRGTRCSTPSPNASRKYTFSDRVGHAGVCEGRLRRPPSAAVAVRCREARDRVVHAAPLRLGDEHRDQRQREAPGDERQAVAPDAHDDRQAQQREELLNGRQLRIGRGRCGLRRDLACHRRLLLG